MTIAGSDPTGGAGLQADLKVFKVFEIHGLSVPTALTAQNTSGVEEIFPIERGVFARQIAVLLADIKPDALKTGMLYSASAVKVVSEMMKEYSLRNLVVDPVTVSSTGTSLVDDGTLDNIRDMLFPVTRIITPNIYEASVFTGLNIEDEDDMKQAAIRLIGMGPEVVIITGGHLELSTLDLFYDGADFHELGAFKIEGEYHGTGCAFSAAVAACLALGNTPLESAQKAKEFVTEAIRHAYHLGKGLGLLYL